MRQESPNQLPSLLHVLLPQWVVYVCDELPDPIHQSPFVGPDPSVVGPPMDEAYEGPRAMTDNLRLISSLMSTT